MCTVQNQGPFLPNSAGVHVRARRQRNERPLTMEKMEKKNQSYSWHTGTCTSLDSQPTTYAYMIWCKVRNSADTCVQCGRALSVLYPYTHVMSVSCSGSVTPTVAFCMEATGGRYVTCTPDSELSNQTRSRRVRVYGYIRMDTICQHCKQNESNTAMSKIFRKLVVLAASYC